MKWLFGQSRRRERLQKVEEMAARDDIQTVGYLAEATRWDKQSRVVAETALIRLLLRLQPEHSSLLNSVQRACLYRYLSLKTSNMAMSLAVLKALENIGNEEALPYIERLTNAGRYDSVYQQLGQAARECLPYLHERILTGHTSQILLRPAALPCIPADAARPGPDKVTIE